MKLAFVPALALSLLSFNVITAVTAEITPCGKTSAGGNGTCPLNMCCSGYGYCGTTAGHCGSGCQPGFGGCTIVPPPSCDPDDYTAGGRKIGYYQGVAASRSCGAVKPQDIDTDGYTHLNFAFASIDNTTFQVIPANLSTDPALYQQFTALQSDDLETWIAIGGGDFSAANSPTQKTWSQLASTKANRAAFIKSVRAFLIKYNFQGVDLDWEFPVDPTHGGQPIDTANYVSLVKELRAALGTDFGLSVILPPAYPTLGYYDPKAMEPYVDMFGWMSYDLHSTLDKDSIIRPHTNLTEIVEDAAPLWFDKLDLGKVNFGLAYYGLGFTTLNTTCMKVGCTFTGGSNPGSCFNSKGFMALSEIETLLASNKTLKPVLYQDEAFKQLTFGNQWIGYDDYDTFDTKLNVASSLCFGGNMVWAIDYA